jgi:RNA polymerase sigma factor (sigma-70 family)
MPPTDPQRFAALIEPQLDALYRAAYRLCRRAADAEDLVQDVCVRAHDKADQLERSHSPRAWLLSVQYHLYVDGTRRERRKRTEPFEEPGRAADQYPSNDAGPDGHAEADLLARTLSAAWQQLNDDQRALLALHAEGYSLAELAEIAGLPPSALKARLHRARARLGKLLKIHRERPRIAAVSGDSL